MHAKCVCECACALCKEVLVQSYIYIIVAAANPEDANRVAGAPILCVYF